MSSEKDSQQNSHCDNKFCTAQVQVTGFGMLLYFIWTMTIVSQYYDSCHFTDGAQKRRSRLPKVTLPVKKKCYMQTQVLWLQSPGSCIHSAKELEHQGLCWIKHCAWVLGVSSPARSRKLMFNTGELFTKAVQSKGSGKGKKAPTENLFTRDAKWRHGPASQQQINKAQQ